jgi:hypothetical protein
MTVLRNAAVLLWIAIVAVVFAAGSVLRLAAQTSARSIPFEKPPDTTGQDAASYFDLPVKRLKDRVPGLRGMKDDRNQEHLPAILAAVDQRIADVMPRLPDLISRERVYSFQTTQSPGAAGGLPAMQPTSREYKYLIRCHRDAKGNTTIEEARVNAKGELVQGDLGYTALRATGFANQWLFFTKANQPEFRFRYLGEQNKDNRKTFVIVFEQDIQQTRDPAYFESEGKRAPFYYQGVLWVDQATFDIVELHTDLLAPVPKVQLLQLTTDLKFRSVPIHGYDAVFWLPSLLDVSIDQGNGPNEESHAYSDYHLFHAETRIVSTP